MKGLVQTGIPNKDIVAAKGNELSRRLILLGITGSPAAVESVELARELMRHGAEVIPVMTPASMNLIHPNLLEWATGNTPVTKLTGRIEHILYTHSTGRRADLFVIAPCTGNTIGKIVAGIDDTPVTSTASAAIGEGIPIILAPAMHDSMWRNPFVIENLKKLRKSKIDLIEPRLEEGKAKIGTIEMIVEVVLKKLSKKDLRGNNVLITAGPTIEYIDPIRLITNKSSGRMGASLAKIAMRRGAYVTLIFGPGVIQPPEGARVLNVETTGEMLKAVEDELSKRKYDVTILSAAASDFIPRHKAPKKIASKSNQLLNLQLKATPKILDQVKKRDPRTFLIAFKAEYDLPEEELIERGLHRLRESKADLIVVNDIAMNGAGFGVETNQVLLIDKHRRVTKSGLALKDEVANQILDRAVSLMGKGEHVVRNLEGRKAHRVSTRSV
jgi:phosphopantothenoylcysteine decarboxylase / phosphopantothenate---cysteine ligase